MLGAKWWLVVDGGRSGHNGKGRPRTNNNANMNGSLSILSRPVLSQSVTSLVSPAATPSYEPLRRLSAAVVAYHYCQVSVPAHVYYVFIGVRNIVSKNFFDLAFEKLLQKFSYRSFEFTALLNDQNNKDRVL